jgi:hypothetical protein
MSATDLVTSSPRLGSPKLPHMAVLSRVKTFDEAVGQ